MASSIKVGGAWKQITGLSTKVGGNWKTVSAAYTKVGGVWKQWYAPVVFDNFNRSTSGGLGTTTSGASWAPLRDVWYANGSSAQCDSAATGYPLAKVGFGNVSLTATAAVSNGTGIAFWIQDKDNWYAAYSFQTTTNTTVNCNPYSCAPCLHTTTTTVYPNYALDPTCSPCTVNTAAVATQYTCDTTTCVTGTTTVCDGVTGPVNLFSSYCPDGYDQVGRTVPTSYNCSGSYPQAGANYSYCVKSHPVDTTGPSSFCNGSSSSTSGSCCCGGTVSGSTTVVSGTGTAGSCNSCPVTYCDTYTTCYQTCPSTTNTWKLRLIKMTAGVISIVGTDVALTATPAAIRVSTESGNIEVFAYSDAAMTTQMGTTLTYTPPTQGPGTAVGLIKAPSDSQGSTVDNLVITL